MRSKRVLAILLSLALLIGLVPVAGMLTTAAADAADPTVYEISFTEGEKISLGYYSKKADNASWVATFEYYLEGKESVTFAVEWGATTSNHTTSLTLEPGKHTATISATCSTAMCPILVAPTGAAGKLYAWNLVMMANDAKKNYYVHEPWQCSFTAHGSGKVGVDCERTTADVTSAKTLSEYVFTDPNTKVYEIAFDAGEKVSLGYYSKKADNAVWLVTFEYYLAGNVAVDFAVEWSATTSNHTTSLTLEPGRHTAMLTATCSTAMCPTLTAPSGESVKLYAWDLAVTANDAKKNYYVHEPWQCSFTAHGSGKVGVDCERTTATVTSAKTYGDYDFENMGKDEGENVTDPNTKVYEIKFEGGNKFDVGYYDNKTANAAWTFTFDYYLDCESDDPFTFGWTGQNVSAEKGSYVLQKGLHTATFGATTESTAISPRFTAKDGMSGKLYVWDLKVTMNGADTAHYHHSPWKCSLEHSNGANKGVECGRTTATVTSDKTYSEYDFENMGKVTDPNTKVYEIAFVGGNKFDVGYYDNKTANAAWTFTFDYYLDCESDDPFEFKWVGQNESAEKGSYVLQKGRHTASFGATTESTAISPRFTAKAGMSGKLYVWDLKVTMNGNPTEYYYHSPWLCEQKDHTCSRTTATVTSDKTYSEYDFENMGGGSVTPPPAPTSPTVFETVFDGGDNVGLGYYVVSGENETTANNQGYARWSISFDYFLDASAEEAFTFSWKNNATANATGSTKLERGLHKAEFGIDVTSNNAKYAISPVFTAVTGASGTLYTWNLKVTANGVDTPYYVHNPWKCVCGKDNCTRTTGEVTSAKTLDQYDFEKMNEELTPVYPLVFETKYENTDKIGLGYYTLSGANKTTSDEQGYARWRVSFDYYLDMETASRFTFAWGNGDTTNVFGSTSLKKGLNKAEFGVDVISDNAGYAISPVFTAAAGASGTLYTWNLKITANGVDVPFYVHNPWKCECGKENCTRTTGVVTFDKTLDQYDFEKMNEDNVSTGDDMNGDGIVSANESTGPVEDNVYRFNFSKYDWEDNDYKIAMIRMAYILFPNKIQEGMELTLSFDYCVQTNCFVYFYNPYATWAQYKENPGTQYTDTEGIRTEFWGPVKDTFTFSFTTNENDVKNGGGTRMALAFEAVQSYGKSDIYFWNLKLTEKGSDVNLLTFDTFYWNNDGMLEVVDIDPEKLEMWETVFEEEDKFDDSIDMDTGDVEIEDDSEPLLDLDTQISLEYEDGSAFGADEFLSIYPYADGELQQEILDVIGDNKYIAYDIGLALGDEFIEPSGTMKVGIPIPDDFDAEQVFLYGTDEFGHLYAIDFENVYGIAYFTTDVLGTFVLVEGELTLPEYPEEGEQEPTDEPVDDNEPTDEPVDADPDNKDDKDDKKDKNKKDDDKSNGWLLWVIIGGGVLLLAAAGVTVFFVLKKKKGAKADAE